VLLDKKLGRESEGAIVAIANAREPTTESPNLEGDAS
jgi:hypothetical protein